MLKLDRPTIFSNHINPVCLPEKHQRFSGEVGIVSGFGHTKERQGSLASILQEANVNIYSNEKCQDMYT